MIPSVGRWRCGGSREEEVSYLNWSLPACTGAEQLVSCVYEKASPHK